jgi:hypothetical protein
MLLTLAALPLSLYYPLCLHNPAQGLGLTTHSFLKRIYFHVKSIEGLTFNYLYIEACRLVGDDTFLREEEKQLLYPYL